jgi:hypothetical protein
MARIILGVIAGFVVWSVLWVGSDAVLLATIGWYAKHQEDFKTAFMSGVPFQPSTTILFMHILRAIVVTLIAGFVAALISRENRRAPLILGVLLLLVGMMFELYVGRYLPLWYHFVFLILLIPVTIAGGKLRNSEVPSV